tara:strand:+ start:898 stop:1518 length:621 start_codon:yes stop_codon:yes gene_type:complete
MNSNNNIYLENKRTIFKLNNKNVNYYKFTLGFTLYTIVFIVILPYILKNYNAVNILSVYFANLDLIASIIGYHGGPYNTFIWKHLYNPSDSSFIGYISTNLINLFALLGVTYTIAYYTYKTKDIYNGWSRAFIILPITYFIPSNFIIYYMNSFGKYLNNYFISKSLIHYILVTLLGFIIAISFIVTEAFLINLLIPYIVYILKYIF